MTKIWPLQYKKWTKFDPPVQKMDKIWPPIQNMPKFGQKWPKFFTKYGQTFTILYKKCYFPNWAQNAGGGCKMTNIWKCGGPRLRESWEYKVRYIYYNNWCRLKLLLVLFLILPNEVSTLRVWITPQKSVRGSIFF